MNSLMKESEVGLALESLQRFAVIGPDALIIQDLGVLHLVRRFFPELKVHASTLMTVNTAMGASYLHNLGFERVVLARELSLKEIRSIQAQSGVELEIFVHGAMCFSYSGLCRFSSLHGGKSSLRGQCVQPCRRRYDWLASGKSGGRGQSGKKGGYFFSMNDLCGIDSLAAIRETGVVSLKIEGRLKSVEYVRNVVRAYRLALDALDQPSGQQNNTLDEAHRYLDAAMGRKRSTGFFVSGQEDRLIVPSHSGSSGEVIGKVTRIERGKGPAGQHNLQLQATLLAPLELGDRLRLYEERSGNRKSFTLRAMECKGKRVERAHKGQTVTMMVADAGPSGFQKTSHGLLFRVDVSGRAGQERSSLTAHLTAGPDPEVHMGRIRKQLDELGMGAPHKGASGQGGKGQRSDRGAVSRKMDAGPPQWWLKVSSLEGARQRFPFQVARVVLDLNSANLERALHARSKQARMPFSLVWSLAPALREEHLSWFYKAIRELRSRGASAFQISHIGQMALFANHSSNSDLPPVEIYGDYSCNVLNTPALLEYGQVGFAGVQFSLETDRATLQEVMSHRGQQGDSRERPQLGLYVYGRPPLFTARLDAPHFQGQRSFVSGRGERFYLDRRPEAIYAFSHDAFSLLRHVDEFSRMGVDYLVVDVSHGAIKRESGAVTALLHGRGELPAVFSGNYEGGLS
jgi:putative protease